VKAWGETQGLEKGKNSTGTLVIAWRKKLSGSRGVQLGGGRKHDKSREGGKGDFGAKEGDDYFGRDLSSQAAIRTMMERDLWHTRLILTVRERRGGRIGRGGGGTRQGGGGV